MIRLALYQPDMPGNLGAAIRLCACLGIPLDVIEPCGFPWNEPKIRTAAMDYWDHVTLQRHDSWEKFKMAAPGRLVLMTTKASLPYTSFSFQTGDTVIMGRESAGVPLDIHQGTDAQLTIPMASGLRSINVINAAAMVMGEALRQRMPHDKDTNGHETEKRTGANNG